VVFAAVLILACGLLAVAVWSAAGMVRRGLIRFRVFDLPNQRSSHATPTPRGGGLAILPLLLLAWAGTGLVLMPWSSDLWALPAGAVILVLISLVDDLKGLPMTLRLVVQAGAVSLGLIALQDSGPVFQGWLPPVLDRLLAALAWLWFINLFNFMDGIDGLAGVEAVSIGTGLGLAAWFLGLPWLMITLPWLLVAAVGGFLPWNWAPAKIFLGEVGSVPLGYLLGWLLLLFASQGFWAPALILPLYFLADASLTLARRALRHPRPWEPHREHAYQRAVQGGWSHAQVVRRVMLCNLILIALAWWAVTGHPWRALLGSFLAVALLLTVLEFKARRAR
jgi:UDP-N-acetylmuramyl pentapeptide phosphotransferase/UDP-N-acetylglucosamine-1-phosphate transferase